MREDEKEDDREEQKARVNPKRERERGGRGPFPGVEQ